MALIGDSYTDAARSKTKKKKESGYALGCLFVCNVFNFRNLIKYLQSGQPLHPQPYVTKLNLSQISPSCRYDRMKKTC